MKFHRQLREKICSREAALEKIQAAKSRGEKIVFTNGCFDLIHPGHVDYLAQARDLGDLLVAGLNTDASVRTLDKAKDRPINNETSRATIIAALQSVDLVVLFNESTPLQLITFLKPDILVKGDDYKVEDIAGADVVIAAGGRVVTIPLLPGFSTTSIVNKIRG
jgi:D-glycero-beta-D-manno-heptose 1-phosphate adenylyltransferase